MPTILRFRGFNIGIYVGDHPPAHVHAKGQGGELILLLACEGGPVRVRGNYGVSAADEAQLIRFVEQERATLCSVWESLHGNDKA